MRQNILKVILKSPRFVTFWANLAQFGANPGIPNESGQSSSIYTYFEQIMSLRDIGIIDTERLEHWIVIGTTKDI